MSSKREIKFVRSLLGREGTKEILPRIYRVKIKNTTASLGFEAIAKLVSQGVIYLGGDKCFASETAKNWLKRQLITGGAGNTGGFAAQHRQVIKTKEGIALNMLEGPVLALSKTKKGQGAFLAQHHMLAATRVQSLVLRSQMMQRTTMSYDPTRVGGKNCGGSLGADLSLSAIDARKALSEMLGCLPADCAGVVMDVCGFQKGLQLIETERRWPRRSAKLILRIGLEQLAHKMGYETVATGANSKRKINSWMQAGFEIES